MADYRWSPIKPLTVEDRAIDLAGIQALYETWREFNQRVQKSSPNQLTEFNRRLVRRLSVETGILERLYDLDRGTTEALVAEGFAEELVARGSTNIEPSRLIDLLRDQEAAVHLVIDCVAKKRELTKSVMCELHAILTRHQETTEAIDQFGKRFQISLLKGKFKAQPNNPRRPDGTVHEYCPPVHVESEVDNLLRWFGEYANEDPIILAAWLHHRFTQIHPFQDGNGRVARALTTMVLLRAELLPLIVDRDLRTEYIKSLEQADNENLATMATIFARLERNTILQALSVDAEAEISHQESLTTAVIESLADKLRKRRENLAPPDPAVAVLRTVNSVAARLRERARVGLTAAFDELRRAVGGTTRPDIYEAGSDRPHTHYYRLQVARTAKKAGKIPNFGEDHYSVNASLRVETEQLNFVVCFYHVGWALTGIMEAHAFSEVASYGEQGQLLKQDFFTCSLEPFVFTYRTNPSQIENAFAKWLDAALAVAVKEYGDRL